VLAAYNSLATNTYKKRVLLAIKCVSYFSAMLIEVSRAPKIVCPVTLEVSDFDQNFKVKTMLAQLCFTLQENTFNGSRLLHVDRQGGKLPDIVKPTDIFLQLSFANAEKNCFCS
jgi:hypothetical protein